MADRPACPACGPVRGFLYWTGDSWLCTRCSGEWSTRSGFLLPVPATADNCLTPGVPSGEKRHEEGSA